jgi:cytoskeleton protein RodZ
MNEDLPGAMAPVAAPSAAIDGSGPSAGTLLRQAREATGLHIAALAVAMKVPVKKLEALEADRLVELHDAVFVRALAGSMCRALKIDPVPVLAKLPQSARPTLDTQARQINSPMRVPGGHFQVALLAFVSKPSVLAVLALLLAALAVVFFPESRNFAPQPPAVPVDKASEVPVPLAAPQASAAEAMAAGIQTVDQNAQSAVNGALPVAASASAPLGVDKVAGLALAAAKPASVPALAASVPQVPATGGLLLFKASSSAWIRVTDSHGVVQFEKTLAAGESAAASGVPPLAVVVGNVSGTELLLRGQPFKLEEVAKDNVARFEVK